MPPATLLATPRPGIDLGDARERLVRHPIYGLVNSAGRLRTFMQTHVFAVWDFQSLLKALQQRLTCTSLPWLPTPDPEARRLVNEIVLDEESDDLPDGRFASHFELYLDGMRRAGADTGPVERLIDALHRQVAIRPAASGGAAAAVGRALVEAGAPPEARAFVGETFDIIDTSSTAGIVAAFTYGREDVIPDMFRGLVAGLAADDPAWDRFRFYLDRHIEHDDEKHAPVCRRIVARLCGDDPALWREASATARRCLEARIALWDALARRLIEQPAAG